MDFNLNVFNPVTAPQSLYDIGSPMLNKEQLGIFLNLKPFYSKEDKAQYSKILSSKIWRKIANAVMKFLFDFSKNAIFGFANRTVLLGQITLISTLGTPPQKSLPNFQNHPTKTQLFCQKISTLQFWVSW